MVGRVHWLRGAAVASAALFCLGADAFPEVGTGFVPVDEETYATFPKVGRYRAFFGAKADLSDRFPTPGHQGKQGSCSAWSTGYAAHTFLITGDTGRKASGPADIVSPTYIYNATRTDPMCRRGVNLPTVLNLLQTEGAVTMAAFPYTVDDCPEPPSQSVRTAPGNARIGGWKAVARKAPKGVHPSETWRHPIVMDDVKGRLWEGQPVVFGMKIPDDWTATSQLYGFKGVYKSAEVYDRREGAPPPRNAHAMTLVGYDDNLQAFRVINSWGTAWGDGGYIWIDYETFQNLVGEAYVLEPLRAGGAATATPVRAPVIAPTPVPVTLPVEQRLAQTLKAPSCGRVSVSTRGGRRVVDGFGGDAAELAAMKTAATGIDGNVDWRVRHRPWPQCEAEMVLERPLADDATKLVLARPGGAAMDGDVAALREDELFTIAVETTAARPYVHVVYVQADGSAVELYRGTPNADRRGKRRVTVGASGAQDVRFQVATPFGDEVILAIASDRELLSGRLADYATEREFLSALKTAVVRAGEQRRPVSAAVRRVRTTKKA